MMSEHPNQQPAPTFANQPRHIKLIVIVAFPFYGALRLIWRAIVVCLEKSVEFIRKVHKICKVTYGVCVQIYDTIAPRIWNGIVNPFIVLPMNKYIIAPIVKAFQIIFDLTAALVSSTILALSCAYDAIFRRPGDGDEGKTAQ